LAPMTTTTVLPQDDWDGDGVKNDVDRFPRDPGEWLDSDDDGIGDNSDEDRDGDSIVNVEDIFPDDPKEWIDSDGDGVGDNTDAYPFDANCYSTKLPCPKKADKRPMPKVAMDPATLDKEHHKEGLPPQGYDEYHIGVRVRHDNESWSGDWRNEWPRNAEETEEESLARICAQHPDNTWCDRYKEHDMFTR